MAKQPSNACDVTGVTTIACSQHGCFCPNAFVDLFKGEQQKNIDFALLEAIRSTGVTVDQGVTLIYDIAYQYSVHLYDCISDRLPPGLEIDRAIGMFHVGATSTTSHMLLVPPLWPTRLKS